MSSDSPTTRVPLIASPANRGENTSTDARLVNGYMEKSPKSEEWHVYKRPGVAISSTVAAGTTGRGIYNWKGNIYTVFNGTLYKDGVSKGAVDNTDFYRFSSCLGSTPKLFLKNATNAYTYEDGGGLVHVTDADYPATTVPGSAFLDGTTYVMTALAAIQGSDLNTPASWDPLNTITAQIEPDGGVAMAHQLVYVVALKQWSTEVFRDAGNATGSPLATVDGAKINTGCRSGQSVAEMDGVLLWAGAARSGSTNVMLMDQLQAVPVSTPAVERLMQQASFTTVYAFTLKLLGHQFYVLTLKNANLTLVFDKSTGGWAQWTDVNGNYFPFVGATYNSSQQVILQHESNGKLYTIEGTNYTDAGSVITFDLYTPNFDGGTRFRKFGKRLDIIGDQTVGSLLQVRCSDDDYKSWSNFRTVDLSQLRPGLPNCGTFRRRAYHFRHQSLTALRLEAAEFQLLLGTL